MAQLIVYEKDWGLKPVIIDESVDVDISRIVLKGPQGKSEKCDIPHIKLLFAGDPSRSRADIELSYAEAERIKNELQNLIDTQSYWENKKK